MPEVQRDSFSIAQFVLFSVVIFVWNVYAFSITNKEKKKTKNVFHFSFQAMYFSIDGIWNTFKTGSSCVGYSSC